ncbi:hypothetical protein BABINDRAFT_9832 [Babjeviella inositovora NRRL Y-12698]|uniref:Nucleolar protein 12 n=1 Tax=Babjeviella inositovora NRRL Y-12698 TaxID=984486 RepID=A0A1E3QJI7_9ASCO|nr:uncharacterized protein BABINDRAFT_9832 [Babjeviella inositovora NRRL Y-12698]ODQ77849.1 hypothetical protein BABINDRAFT_9832 [Babjeviella inositovora NRRL Y-12698]
MGKSKIPVEAPATSISSIFGTVSQKVDESIDALFKSSAGPVQRTLQPRTVSSSRRSATAKKETEAEAEAEAEAESEQPRKKRSKKARDEEDDLEGAYLTKLMKDDTAEESKEEVEENSDSDSESETETKTKKTRAAKIVDLKETELTKAEATVFVGNVSSTVITNKATYKLFKAKFAEFGAVKSIRFRSISFEDALPRKVAFVQQKFHSTRDTVNAYVVYEKKEFSIKAVALNGTVFQENHLRVDHVAHPASQDNKRSIFVGNLDFEEKEESLWRYFEEVSEVEYVRIVRDSKTNVGKGFAYVQFKDSLGVNKSLLLNEKPLKTSEKKRKLRISRCMNIRPSSQTPQRNSNGARLNEQQKTKLGRAKKILGKADKAQVGKLVHEGMRATKGDRVSGIKNGLGKVKKPRHKKPRIRDRSSKFKDERNQMQKELSEKK